MQHLGDITKIDWAHISPVDCVTGGSPCQDLSIAGKRAGLAGARSSLYMEQINGIKELRKADELRGRSGEFVRPRYMVWENVVGAFSSNKGADFSAVLTEAVRVIEPEAPDVPVPEKGWSYAGTLMGDGWSVAWRTHNAQHWGVPQRRRRISLVCDFGGHTAPEILFERKSLFGDSAKIEKARKEASGDLGMGAEGAVNRQDHNKNARGREGNTVCGSSATGKTFALRMRSGCPGGGKGPLVQKDLSGTLKNVNDQTVFCLQGNFVDRNVSQNGKGLNEDVTFTLNAVDRHVVFAAGETGVGYWQPGVQTLRVSGERPGSPNNVVVVLDARGNGNGVTAATLVGDHQGRVSDYTALCIDCRNCGVSETSGTLQAKENGGYSLNYINPVFCIGNGQANQSFDTCASALNCMHDQQSILTVGGNLCNMVRRLTPLECERLQGFPDGWTDTGEWIDSKGKKHKDSDSPRYKALGNSIALPFWYFLTKRISAQYTKQPTLGSLFDGIGGFPLCWESVNGKGSALWASEIDEFPMAITKIYFGEESK